MQARAVYLEAQEAELVHAHMVSSGDGLRFESYHNFSKIERQLPGPQKKASVVRNVTPKAAIVSRTTTEGRTTALSHEFGRPRWPVRSLNKVRFRVSGLLQRSFPPVYALLQIMASNDEDLNYSLKHSLVAKQTADSVRTSYRVHSS